MDDSTRTTVRKGDGVIQHILLFLLDFYTQGGTHLSRTKQVIRIAQTLAQYFDFVLVRRHRLEALEQNKDEVVLVALSGEMQGHFTPVPIQYTNMIPAPDGTPLPIERRYTAPAPWNKYQESLERQGSCRCTDYKAMLLPRSVAVGHGFTLQPAPERSYSPNI